MNEQRRQRKLTDPQQVDGIFTFVWEHRRIHLILLGGSELLEVPMRVTAILLLCNAALAGCGYSEPSREIGGAMTGAGTGATIGLLGGPVGAVGGALIGAAAGAATGAVVSPGHLNLGAPIWSDR